MCNGNCKNCNGNCGRCQRGFVNKEESTMKRLSKNEFADIFYDLSKMCLLGDIIDTVQLPIMLGAVDGDKLLEILKGLHEKFADDCKKLLTSNGLSPKQTVQELINSVTVTNYTTTTENKVFSKDDFAKILHTIAGASMAANLVESLYVAGSLISLEAEEVLDVLIDIYNDMMDDTVHTLEDKYGIDADDLTVGGLLEMIEIIE